MTFQIHLLNSQSEGAQRSFFPRVTCCCRLGGESFVSAGSGISAVVVHKYPKGRQSRLRPASNSNMATSRDRVFALPELLEAILLELPVKKLLLVQRVSKHWQTTIKASVSIQQALFYTPKPLSSTTSKDRPDINPVLNGIIHRVNGSLSVETISKVYRNDDYVEIPGAQYIEDCKNDISYSGHPYERQCVTINTTSTSAFVPCGKLK